MLNKAKSIVFNKYMFTLVSVMVMLIVLKIAKEILKKFWNNFKIKVLKYQPENPTISMSTNSLATSELSDAKSLKARIE